MARLTRTQKYAELRDKIAQDREESLKTDSLSQYEDKLRKLESFVSNEPDTNLNKRVETVTPVDNNTNKAQEERMKSLDDILNSMMDIKYVNEAPKQETKEEPQVEVKPEPVVEAPVQPTHETHAPSIEKPVETMSTMEIIVDEVKELSDIIGPIETVIEEKPEPVIEKPVDIMSTMEIVVDEAKELSDIIGPIDAVIDDNTRINNSFIDDTLKGVDDYNRQKGRTTLDKLPDSIVDEVRHPQTAQENKPVEEKVEDNDFSNTVTLEIEKVLAEIREQGQASQNDAPEETAVFNAAELEAEEAFNNAEVKSEAMEHPVLAKALEEPVVEIKNINETLSNPTVDANVLDDTIPFDAIKAENDEEEYEDEDEAPSKVLNVILGILIFVLVAVLGVIVYYILVAKGIIG
ncbi:MAG: hypothetical protein Q4F12_01235 [Erysipelotrichaceae bacterium]|nr:hypothetical protein [Erysipelotrichaceae bacterium]